MRRRSGAGAAAALIAACVFGAALLLSVAAGAGIYRQVRSRTDAMAAERLGLAYITAKLHGHDAKGSVRAGAFGGGDAVILSESIDGTVYETIFYVYRGWLMELLCERGREPGPEAGQQIAEAQRLSVTESGGLLRLSFTDENGRTGTADIFLRSGG